MKLLKWILIGGAIAWVWSRIRGTQPKPLPADTEPTTPTSPPGP